MGFLDASAESILRILVTLAGAGIVIGGCMVSGLRAHRIAERFAPSLVRGIPSDVPIVVGLAAGVCIVISWAG
jgi:hypothetical protein